MLKSRLCQLSLSELEVSFLISTGSSQEKAWAWDRSIIGDYAFALWNHFSGKISLTEMQAYENGSPSFFRLISIELGKNFFFSKSVKHPEAVSGVLYLNDEPAQCKNRVEQLRNNKSEADIPLEYYEVGGK